MKVLSLILSILVAGGPSFLTPSSPPRDFSTVWASFDCRLSSSTPSAIPQPADPFTLENVLKKMDSVATNFHTTEAQFEWDIYQRVIDDIADVETGTIYYRRTQKGVEMMAAVKMAGSSASSLKPQPKYVLFSEGVVRMYEPKIDQVTLFDLGKNHTDFERYVVLGFGGSGEDLQKSFDVSYDGAETVSGVNTARLKLIPKSQKVRDTYSQIFLWIDMDRGISIQQKFVSPQQDYKLAKYSEIQVNGKKIPDDVFKLKTTSKTQTVSPRG